jgi:hypothetical protein
MRIHRRRRRGCGKAGNSLTVFRFSINLPLTIQTVAERTGPQTPFSLGVVSEESVVAFPYILI